MQLLSYTWRVAANNRVYEYPLKWVGLCLAWVGGFEGVGWIWGCRVAGGLSVLTRKWCCWPSYSLPWSGRTSNLHSCSYLHRRATGSFEREFWALCSALHSLHDAHFPRNRDSAWHGYRPQQLNVIFTLWFLLSRTLNPPPFYGPYKWTLETWRFQCVLEGKLKALFSCIPPIIPFCALINHKPSWLQDMLTARWSCGLHLSNDLAKVRVQ